MNQSYKIINLQKIFNHTKNSKFLVHKEEKEPRKEFKIIFNFNLDMV